MKPALSLLLKTLSATFALATVFNCTSIHAADSPPSSATSKTKIAIPALETGAKSLYSSNLAISKSIAAKSAEAKSPRAISHRSVHTMSTIDVDGGVWYALKLEFENADACKKFNAEGT